MPFPASLSLHRAQALPISRARRRARARCFTFASRCSTSECRRAVDGAAAGCCAAGITARLPGPVLWCVTQADLCAPGLQQARASLGRMINVEAGDDTTLLSRTENGARDRGSEALVTNVARLSLTTSRRLYMADKAPRTTDLAPRRLRRRADASNFCQPTAAITGWRVVVLP